MTNQNESAGFNFSFFTWSTRGYVFEMVKDMNWKSHNNEQKYMKWTDKFDRKH